jgi:glycosyltransferase involved in cell wall biosynthesis
VNILWFNWKDRRNPLAGGAEVVNEELAKRLAAEGHNVTFVVAGFAGADAEERHDGFRVVRVGGRVTGYIAAWRYYRRHRAELNPDLVIDECNTIPFFAGWYVGRPTVVFLHMLCRVIWFYQLPLPLGLVGWLLEPVYLRLLPRSRGVITVSDSTRRDLLRHGFREQDIRIISEGIELRPLAQLHPADKYTLPTLLSLGAMRSMKRTLDQIKAFEIAKTAIPNLRLVVAGDASGRYGQKVLRAIRQSPYAADIDYRGRVSDAERLALMRACHVIVVTSVKEGWGLIVTEAASQGTPAVVYDVDGLRDSVRHGQTGLIVAPTTPVALASRIEELLADRLRYQHLRRNAWEWSKSITFDRAYIDFKEALRI